MAQSTSLKTTLGTSLALIDQFLAALDLNNASRAQSSSQTNHPSPLHLLTASAASLKSTTTKVSLLTITTPFTPSAVTSVLQPLNTSILPSLVTAALLASPTLYPESFAKECNVLTLVSLRDLKFLLNLVKTRAEDGKPKNEVPDKDRKSITEATGKVWEDCDLIAQFSKNDVVGFVCKKASQWLDLMKDAVQEFKDWDPKDDVGDDPFGLNDAQSDNDEDETSATRADDSDRATMSSGVKDQALTVLSRIPQSVHVVVKQRLEKLPKEKAPDAQTPMVPMSAERRKKINLVIKRTRQISDCIDESAEAMYMGDPELCLKKAGEARALTIDVVEAVIQPWEPSDKESKEDQYIKRALLWIQQVEPNGKPGPVQSTEKGKGKA